MAVRWIRSRGLFRLPFVFFAVADLVFTVACVPIEPADDSLSAILQHSATVSEANALIAEVRVSLTSPAAVFVEYDNPLAGRYRTRLEAPAVDHTIPIVRLRPETTYDYTIFTVYGADETVRGPGGSFTTGALPKQLASVFTVAAGRSSQPLVLTDYTLQGDGFSSYFVFWDEVGALVWYMRPDRAGPVARRAGEGNFVFIPWRRTLKQFTPLGEVIDLADGIGDLHHDLVLLDEGRVLFPISVVDRFGSDGLRARYDSLAIWHSATGRVEEVWNAVKAWDILDPAQHWEPAGEEGVWEWTHLNSVSLGVRGNVLLSLRNRSQVVSLTPNYEIEWQLHGPNSDYEFPNPADRFYKQHTAAQLANGNILLFDNGKGRPEAEGGEYSRALELRLDDAAGTAVKVWEYRPNPDIYAHAVSSAYRLNGGNTLVTFGIREVERRSAPLVVVEVDANGDDVFRVETVQLHEHPLRYRAYGGIEAIRGETMLRPPTSRVHRPPPMRLHYEDMTLVAAGFFDIYFDDGYLVYAKAPCATEDIAPPFFLHVTPRDVEDLAAHRHERGFENMDFNFLYHGLRWQERCHAEVPLPEFEIGHIRTGQFVADETAGGGSPHGPLGPSWSVEIPLGSLSDTDPHK